jgi:cilia- and flagella-associated protein 52
VLHKVSVQALDFSSDSSLLASLGGQDDNSLVIWDVASGAAICGSPAASHAALALTWLRNRNDRLMTGGQYHLRTWSFQADRRRLEPEDAKVGSVKRIFTCIAIDDSDSFAYCGTSSGDLLQVDVAHGHFVQASKSRFSLGIVCATHVPDRTGGCIIIGTGDSALARLRCKSLDVEKASELLGAVTSVSPSPDGARAMVGTDQGNVYLADLATLAPVLQSTAHSSPVRLEGACETMGGYARTGQLWDHHPHFPLPHVCFPGARRVLPGRNVAALPDCRWLRHPRVEQRQTD